MNRKFDPACARRILKRLELQRRGCSVTLLISPKEVDQRAVQGATGMDIVTLPAVALTRGGVAGFARGFLKSYRAARAHFKKKADKKTGEK